MKLNKEADTPFLAYGLVYLTAVLISRYVTPILSEAAINLGAFIFVILFLYLMLKRKGYLKVDPDYGNPNTELLEQLKHPEIQKQIVSIVRNSPYWSERK